MTTIIYNHAEKSMRAPSSSTKGMLNYDKKNKRFSCDASDLDCAGVENLPSQLRVKIEENGHTKIFNYSSVKVDDEGELQYYTFKSVDGMMFVIYND